ncbi:conserved hypothetical protein [Ricinus communis]|uniref:RNase H type-1 domain-containing protein n=1 Tax=Ricinus communis TaxID=3988 RepID=B9SFW4_RICCO|nr:conserved hypothetical protein [Ricinus communis]
MKLDTDGAYYCTSTQPAKAGGILRDCYGNWVSGFTVNTGSCSITEAELWGLHQGFVSIMFLLLLLTH